MKLTFLGTGTSCGVPTIGCHCYTCSSEDSRDKRLRCSALIETQKTRLLIDCGPDFRQQIMDKPFRRIDGILITHAHYDHIGGIDDIRPYCQFGEVRVYADPVARAAMLQMLPYCFAEHRYPGVPAIQLLEIEKHHAFAIGEIQIMPIEVMHHDLPITGYIFSDGMCRIAYITDMKTIDSEEIAYLQNLDVLVINALRIQPHHSHQTLNEAVAFAKRVGAGRTLLVHASHDIGRHREVNAALPPGIQLAYDGQIIHVE